MNASKKKKTAAKTLAQNRKTAKPPRLNVTKAGATGNRKAVKKRIQKSSKVTTAIPTGSAKKGELAKRKLGKTATVNPAHKNRKTTKVVAGSQKKTNPQADTKKSPVLKVAESKTKRTQTKVASKPAVLKQLSGKTKGKVSTDVEEKSKSVSPKVPQKSLTSNNGKALSFTPQAKIVASVEIIPPPSNTNPEIVAKIRSAQAEKELRKDLAQPAPITSLTPLNPIPTIIKGKDRLVLMVRDPYWIQAHWDIMRHSVDRAKAALAENWHTVKPILRLLKLDDSGTTNNSEVIYRDIEIHGGVRNWYVDVDSPPSRFKMLMGYICANGRFYELARSNIVTTPALGGKEATDDHWANIATDAEHIYSMSGGYADDTQTGDLTEVFEEKLKRTMDADVLSQFGSGAEGSLKRHKQFHFDVNAELVVFGSTHPEAHVSVGTEPVKVRSDGSFSIRLPLPDRRQVLPATAKSRDGVDEQTVVIAVERNTKVMEPLSSDTDDL